MSFSLPHLFFLFCFLWTIFCEDNGLALTPIMGWETWSHFRNDWNETIIKETAQYLKSSGLFDLGYNRVNLDGGWAALYTNGSWIRNSTGYLVPDPNKFPNGMKSLSDFVHGLGLYFGHYASAPVSMGNEEKDIELYISWGIDSLKVDALDMSRNANFTFETVQKWSQLLNATGRKIIFSNCHMGCMSKMDERRGGWHPWCRQLTNMWRVNKDIQNSWADVMHGIDTLVGIGDQAGPGNWNDADFMEIGNNCPLCYPNKPLSDIEGRTHFNLWCITSQPLMIGTDIRNMSLYTFETLSNKEAIQINQAWAGFAGDRLSVNGTMEIWTKPTKGSLKVPTEVAVVLFNRDNNNSQEIMVMFDQLNLPEDSYIVYDIWMHKEVGVFQSSYKVTLMPHESAFVRVYSSKNLKY